MGKAPPEVIVVDINNRFLEYTHPGAARILLKNKEAVVFSTNPFAIKLNREVEASSIRRSKVMAVASPRNFTEYFNKERDVYVQNMADAQISVEFPMANNRFEGFLFPNSRNPVNLSQFIPFDAIKASMDFRKLISRRPAVLQLLDEAEYKAFYSKRAAALNLKTSSGKPDVDAAIDLAEAERLKTADKNSRDYVTDKAPEPIHEVVEKGSGPGGANKFGERTRVAATDAVTEDETIKPRILHLCNQVKAELPEEERMPAKDLLMELQNLSDLTTDDLEYIRAHSFYKTVKKWAKEKLSELAAQEESDDEPAAATT